MAIELLKRARGAYPNKERGTGGSTSLHPTKGLVYVLDEGLEHYRAARRHTGVCGLSIFSYLEETFSQEGIQGTQPCVSVGRSVNRGWAHIKAI